MCPMANCRVREKNGSVDVTPHTSTAYLDPYCWDTRLAAEIESAQSSEEEGEKEESMSCPVQEVVAVVEQGNPWWKRRCGGRR